MAAQVWLESSPVRPIAELGGAGVAEDARRPLGGNVEGNAGNVEGDSPLACWGHDGPARPEMATAALIGQFGSLAEAMRIYETLSDTAKNERPELKEWFREHD